MLVDADEAAKGQIEQCGDWDVSPEVSYGAPDPGPRLGDR
jgi:hypothetical protein